MSYHEATLRAVAEPQRLDLRGQQPAGTWVPAACIALVLAMQAVMLFNRAINWDEFYHYSLVEQFRAGILSQPLQTVFVRLFQWVPALPGTSVDHIVVIRLFSYLCEIVAAAGTAILAGRFTDRTIGLLCALAYLSAGFVMQHGFSFRADPVAAALLMSALCILACTSLRGIWLVLFGCLLGLSALYTIKVVLYAPAFAGLAWWRWQAEGFRPAFVLRMALAGFVAALLFGLLYYYHAHVGVRVEHSGQTVLAQSARKMFRLGIQPYWFVIVKAAWLAPILTIAIIAFPFALTKLRAALAVKVALFGLFLPITVLAFYHNTAPYFYTFILPPVAAASAVPFALALRRTTATMIALLLAAFAVMCWMWEPHGIIDRQRTILKAAASIFPQKIAYFDFCAMLAGHEKANVFMTPWGSSIYRAGGSPTMRQTMQAKAVPLLVENDPMFTRLLRTDEPVPEFLPDDAALLRETYVHFWGPFWVAGHDVPATADAQHFAIAVPGPYTVEGAAVLIDGRVARPGGVVMLDRGQHVVTALDRHAARLIWGDHLRKPAEAAPPRPYWQWF